MRLRSPIRFNGVAEATSGDEITARMMAGVERRAGQLIHDHVWQGVRVPMEDGAGLAIAGYNALNNLTGPKRATA